jgi:HNH endonuclease
VAGLIGRRRRRATQAQRRALLRRDGGCARPGCSETRTERLHTHHMRHWWHGGRTDLANLVLLCDADHGAVHDLDLVMSRRDGRLVVTAPDGRRVWGPADGAFTTGLPGLPDLAGRAEQQTADAPDPFVAVDPIDQQPARRPSTPPAPVASRAAGRARRRLAGTAPGGRRPAGGRPVSTGMSHGSGRRVRQRRPSAPATTTGTVGGILTSIAEVDLPDAMHINGERMDLRHVVSVLMGHRDFVRRLEAEVGTAPTG